MEYDNEDVESLCDILRKIMRIFRKDVGHIVLDYLYNVDCDICRKYIDFEKDNIYVDVLSYVRMGQPITYIFGLNAYFYHYKCKDMISSALICFQCKMTNLRYGFTSCHFTRCPWSWSWPWHSYNNRSRTCYRKVCRHIEISADHIKKLTEKNIFCHACQNDLNDMKKMCKRSIDNSVVVNRVKQCWGCELYFCEHILIGGRYCIKCF